MYPTKKDVTDKFEYENGLLYLKKSGVSVGWITDRGYFKVHMNGKEYFSHRLIWIYHFGVIGSLDIDHIDRDKANNRIENLRTCTRSANLHNATAKRDNKGGCVGVAWNKKHKYWEVEISINYARTKLGIYKDYFEACCIRKAFEVDNRSDIWGAGND